MMSQTGKQAIAILILTKISRNKGTQTMKFENLSSKKSNTKCESTKCDVETIPKPFPKKSNISISLNQ